MKKLLYCFIFIFGFFTSPVQAEEILDFDQMINLKKNGDMEISEAITYDFDTETKHGIFRDIPYKYDARGGKYKLRISDVSVADAEGNEYKFEILNEGSDKRIKIGDDEKLVSGKKVYVIKYTVERAINFFDDHDEVYWNVTGDKWPVAIRQSKSTIILPEKIKEEEMKMECFAGPAGSTGECVSKRFVYEGAGMVKQAVFIDDILQPNYGFTIVVGMPKGVLVEPSFISKFFETMKDNVIIALPFLIFFAMFWRWRKHGRDMKGRETIVAQFDAPEGLSPMGVGTLVDESADNKDFAANIISLAVKGYIKIVRIEEGKWFKKTDYALIKVDGVSSETALRPVIEKSESFVLDKFFKTENIETDEEKITEIRAISGHEGEMQAVLLSELKNKFYKDLSKIKSDIYEELTTAGYFKANPQKTRIAYGVIGIMIAFLGFFLASFGVIYLISVVLSGLIIAIFGFFMPAKTEKGVLAKEHILGLKEYLRVAEADRIKFHNAPEKNPQIFEKLLPYAMVLGVEKEWAKQFEDIYKDNEPNWYYGGNTHAFSAIALSDSMRSFSTVASAAASSTPSQASGGGFGFSGGGVGGGFGGGGGGSW